MPIDMINNSLYCTEILLGIGIHLDIAYINKKKRGEKQASSRCGLLCLFFQLHFLLERRKVSLKGGSSRLSPQIPDILATRSGLVFDCLPPVVIPNRLLALLIRIRPGLHAEPEIVPVLVARPQLSISVHIDKLSSK